MGALIAHTVRELLGPRHQVPPARARGKTVCGVSRRVARGCWEGPISPPDPQACPVYQPYPHSRYLTDHPGQGCSRRIGGRTCVPAGRICLIDRVSNTISSSTRSDCVLSDLYEKQHPVSRSLTGRLRRRRTKDLKLFEILRPHGLSRLATPRLRSRRQHTAFGWEALSTTPVRWEITSANEKLVARPTKFRTR